jgi:hypothetical protein
MSSEVMPLDTLPSTSNRRIGRTHSRARRDEAQGPFPQGEKY